MPRYADPARCPDCAAALPAAPGRCPSCGLPLTGPLAGELLRTLRRADDLLDRLRAGIAAPAPAGAVPSTALYPPPSDASPVRSAAAATTRRTGLTALSVPKILLGLGAVCLLVAAVIFLAVAWSWIGVGGRTAVLLAATFATGALGVRLARGGLRIAAEALTAVSLGLVVLDLVGAQSAGWLGDLEGSGLVTLVGSALVVTGGVLLAALLHDSRRLVVPQLAVVLGALVAMAAVHDLLDQTTAVLVVEVLVCAGAVRAVLGRSVPVIVWGLAGVGALTWSVLVLYGFWEATDGGDQVTLSGLWGAGDGVALLAAAVLALLPIAVLPARPAAWQVALSFASAVVTAVLVLPALDNGATDAATAWLVALALWTAVAAGVLLLGTPTVLHRSSLAVRVPLGLTAVVVFAVLAAFLDRAVVAVLGVGVAFSEQAGVRLDPGTAQAHPALVLPGALALLAAAYVARGSRPRHPEVAVLVLVLAGLVTAAQYAVPLAVVVAALVALGVAALADALRRDGTTGRVEAGLAVLLLAAGTCVALPSAGLTAAALGAVLAAALAVLALGHLRGAGPLDRAAGTVVPLAFAGVVWSSAQALDTSTTWCAGIVLVVTGLLALALPRVEIELAASVAVLLSVPVSVAAAGDGSVSLAVHLTIAGALVTATSLLHRERRPLAALGGLLLAAATWVRLADLGVSAPEAYTLPTALVLLAVGADRLRRDAEASTTRTLLPGLVLGTVPSLLWVLDDPISPRALVLGLACLALVIAGAQARWSAPLLVGAVVGGVLVLSELAPYAVQTPQWVAIGLAGTVLTVVGVTWEKRLAQVQQATAFLARLR